MKAIILAAGMARRLGELTRDRPKCLLDIAGIPILQHQIKVLESAGIRDIVVVKGFRGEMLRSPSLRYCENAVYEKTNMVTSLFCAADELVGDVIIAYADVLYDEHTLATLLAAPDQPISVIVDLEWERYYRERFGDPFAEAESLVLGKDLRIREIGASHPRPVDVQGQYIGLIRVNARGADILRSMYNRFAAQFRGLPWIRGRTFEQAYMTDFLQAMIDQQVPLNAVPIRGGWLEFDTPRDYQLVIEWHRAGRLGEFCRLRIPAQSPLAPC